MSIVSEANTARVTESSWNPSTDDISPADVEPASWIPGYADRMAATTASKSVSYVQNSSPALGRSPASASPH